MNLLAPPEVAPLDEVRTSARQERNRGFRQGGEIIGFRLGRHQALARAAAAMIMRCASDVP